MGVMLSCWIWQEGLALSALVHSSSFRQNSMTKGGLSGVGSGVVAVHSPERRGNFCCAEETAVAMRTIAPNAADLRKDISTCLFLKSEFQAEGSRALLSMTK